MDVTTTLGERDLIRIWGDELDGIATLCDGLDDDQWRAATPCPGWSTADVVAHLIDIEQILAGAPRPDHEPDWSRLEHIAGDFNLFTEVGVDYRRGLPRVDVIAELRATIARRREQLDALPEGAEVVGPFGNPTTLDRLMRIRILDSWIHERDIRTATGVDAPWDSPAAVASFQQLKRTLPVVWSADVAAPEGATVRIEVSGPGLAGDMCVVVGEDGRGHAVEVPSDATVHLVVSWPDLVALSAGRVDPADPVVAQRLRVSGDADLASALLAELAITP
jgi:uncharacterized protein (TIGR03083 family)